MDGYGERNKMLAYVYNSDRNFVLKDVPYPRLKIDSIVIKVNICSICGTALTGGVGGPQRTLLGVIIITWIQAGLLMLGVGRTIQLVVFGLIAIIMGISTIDRRRIRIIK